MRCLQSWLCPLPGLPIFMRSSGAQDEGLGCWGLPQTRVLYLETPSSGPRRALFSSGHLEMTGWVWVKVGSLWKGVFHFQAGGGGTCVSPGANPSLFLLPSPQRNEAEAPATPKTPLWTF